MELPEPVDLTSLVIRTDFSDDDAWQAVQATIDATGDYSCATYVTDLAYDSVTVQALVESDAFDICVFLADATTMATYEHLLLAIDLEHERGRTFRVPARWYTQVSDNLCIGNMGFEEFADFADARGGTYRGD